MKKIYEIALSALMLLTLAGCTLMLDVMPEEEEPQEEVDLDKVGFDKPYTLDVENSTCTYQYGDSTKVFEREMFDYIVDVYHDSIIYLTDNIPEDLLIRPGYYVSRIACLEFPMGLNHKVVDLVHRNGMYEMYIEPATEKEVFKVYKSELSYDVDVMDMLKEMSEYEEEVKGEPLKVKEKNGELMLQTASNRPFTSWVMFKEIPAPISKVSPYSRKLKMPRRRTRAKEETPIDDKEETVYFTLKYNDAHDQNLTVESDIFKPILTFLDPMGGGTYHTSVRFPPMKNPKVKQILEAIDFNITFSSVLTSKGTSTKEVKNGHTYKQEDVTAESKTIVKVKGGYDLMSKDEKSRKEVINAIKDAFNGGSGKLPFNLDALDKILIIPFSAPAPGSVGFFRTKCNPDLVAVLNGEATIEIDGGERRTISKFIDDKADGKPYVPAGYEPRKPKDTSVTLNGSCYFKFLVGIELYVGAGVPLGNNTGTGLCGGVYIEPSITLTCQNPSNLFTDKIKENYVMLLPKVDFTAKAGIMSVVNGDEEYWWGSGIALGSIGYPVYAYPTYINRQALLSNQNAGSGGNQFDKLNLEYTLDSWGIIESLRRKNAMLGAHVYQTDSKGEIIGEPVFRVIPVTGKIGEPVKSTFNIPQGMKGGFAVVPVVAYGNNSYNEYRYAAFTAVQEWQPELRIVDFQLLSGLENDNGKCQYTFDLQLNAYQVAQMIKQWSGVAVDFRIWRYDKVKREYKIVDRNGMYVDITNYLFGNSVKIMYDLVGTVNYNLTKQERENRDRYAFYLLAAPYHWRPVQGTTSFVNFIHYLDGNGIASEFPCSVADLDVNDYDAFEKYQTVELTNTDITRKRRDGVLIPIKLN